MKYDAFISYRRENGFLMAQIIHDRLAERHISTFLDLEELRSGKFNEKLYEAIDESKNFILILPNGALDRCVSPDDWVRKEILEAVKMNKTIIPILCDDFHWPRDKYKDMPQELCTLEDYNAVKSTQDYLGAMIDRLIGFMIGIDSKKEMAGTVKESYEYISPEQYFANAIENIQDLKEVDMAFHGGAEWFAIEEKVEVLYALANTGIQLRILLNKPETAEIIAQHMRHQHKMYTGFDQCVSLWEAFANEYPDHVEVRLVDIPLLRRYYSLHMKNAEKDTVNVKFYTYANSKMDKNYQPIFYTDSAFFELYRDEFDYLWERAK